jgi:hypothetical protein
MIPSLMVSGGRSFRRPKSLMLCLVMSGEGFCYVDSSDIAPMHGLLTCTSLFNNKDEARTGTAHLVGRSR